MPSHSEQDVFVRGDSLQPCHGERQSATLGGAAGALSGPLPRPRGLVDALRQLAPSTVRVGCRTIDAADGDRLHSLEWPAVAGSVPKRVREFASGRVLLHELLGEIGPILVGPTRAPRWPAGVRGSLAHDDCYAVAAVTRDPEIQALGIDIEPATPLSAGVARLILRPEERELDPHLAFVLKEAAYKAWSGLGGGLLDHQDVALTVDRDVFQASILERGTTLRGRFARRLDRMIALVVVPAGDGERS